MAINITVLSTERVFPTTSPSSPVRKQLSIIDASSARFTPAGAIWYFTPPTHSAALDPVGLKSSLEQVLESYAQWTGQLRMVPYLENKTTRTNDERYGRLELNWGKATDPGVLFVVASTESKIDVGLPGGGRRACLWQCDDTAREDVFLPKEPLATYTSAPDHNDACVAVQVTTFVDGGVAIGMQMFHSLGDAITLSRFMHDWSAVHEAMLSKASRPMLSPVYEPILLDRIAADSLDSPEPDTKILQMAHQLPLHRYDWWASKENSGFGPQACAVPKPLERELGAQQIASAGQRLPWHTLDAKAPVSHTIIHFTAAQLGRIWTAASPTDPSGPPITRHDALVAHIWGLINRARGPEGNDENSEVYADMTIGLRKRVSPPLPASWLGSPLQIVKVGLPWSVVSNISSLPRMAAAIKSTVGLLTPQAIAAQVYATAYELAPFRLWQAFVGRQHVLVTSWAHTDLYGCGFGTRQPPRYVHPIMPLTDGCVQIMESSTFLSEGEDDGAGRSQNKRWYEGGVDVAIYLESEAMGRLLRDTNIWLSMR